MPKCIVWLQYDLRLQDNPALAAALNQHQEIFPLFIWNPAAGSPWAIGAASRVWLEQSLAALEQSLVKIGLRLSYMKGGNARDLVELCQRHQIGHVYFNERTEPNLVQDALHNEKALASSGIEVRRFQAHTLVDSENPPRNDSGGHYKVYGAFSRRLLKDLKPRSPIPLPERTIPDSAKHPLTTTSLSDLGIAGTSAWEKRLRSHWQIGEKAATQRLADFLDHSLNNYAMGRDIPSAPDTSRLSAHLKFGEISPFQIWQQLVKKFPVEIQVKGSNARRFVDELLWREFSQSILMSSPEAAGEPLRQEFKLFPWSLEKDAAYTAWCHGETGFPLIDASMRQLWETGWMHNRVRMLCASFLVKHLQKSWLLGAQWFWDTLVDADLANNSLSWQWCAGCGVDAAPYFRIFNPILQSRKFDPHGLYIKTWLPELHSLSAEEIHTPWTLKSRDGAIPLAYPLRPIVEHEIGRMRTLIAYKKFRAQVARFG